MYSLIINHLNIQGLKLYYKSVKGNFYFDTPIKKNSSKIKEKIKFTLNKIGNFFLKQNDALIINSYLSSLQYIKLNFYLKQFPQYHLRKEVIFFPPGTRDLLLPKTNHTDSKLQFIQKHFYKFFPACFYESYNTLEKFQNNDFFPSKPKFIFTSNSFDYDEVFKIWVAKKTEENFKYFVGQHGNNYGQHFYLGNSSWPERSTPHGFISWGWDDNRKNTLKGFNFKKSIDVKYKQNKKRLLLINTCVEHNYFPWDAIDDYRKNFSEQINFAKNLKDEIQKSLTVRLYQIQNQFDFEEEKIWKKDFNNLSIDRNIFSFKKSVQKSRLCIFSYDSTGFLELICNNIPCVAFWPNLESHLNNDTKFYYRKLKKCKIIHESGKDAALFVNEIWDDIGNWWNSKSVIEARNIFSDNYTKKVNNVAFELTKLIDKNL